MAETVPLVEVYETDPPVRVASPADSSIPPIIVGFVYRMVLLYAHIKIIASF
jgi:hypothetical protein